MLSEVREVDLAQLDALIERIKTAQDSTLAFDQADLDLILNILLSFITLQTQLSDKEITIGKLRKLAGMVSSDERLKKLLKQQQVAQTDAAETGETPAEPNKPVQPEAAAQPKVRKPRTKPHKRQHTTIEFHKLSELQKNMTCLECGTGTLGKYSPAEFIRISGNSPFEVTKHVMERLRCNQCGAYFTAPLSPEAAQDGSANQQYGYSARALMALNKYYMGSPFYRQNTLQSLLHVHISASSIYDQCRQVALVAQPVFKALTTVAANAAHYELDDTPIQVLDQTSTIKTDRKTGALKTRTGINTSGLIATLSDGKKITLYNTEIGHAGEFLDNLLLMRTHPEPPVIMSDALSSNNVYNADTIRTNCNAHGRRQFVDVLTSFEKDVTWCLEQYGRIWQNDKATHAMSPEERQRHHHEHSLPIMKNIQQWAETQLAGEAVEENSGLGRAMRYFLKHYDKLVGFCHIPGARIDNNRMEATLKLAIRNRKNAYFYKTQNGADTGDILTSLIATCAAHGVNPFDYLIFIQRYHDAVKLRPMDFLPWNYLRAFEKTA